MRSGFKGNLIAVAVTFGGVVAAILLAEVLLRFTAAEADLPPDGVVDGVLYTWGNKVEQNSFGYREREIAPKRSDVLRVMVLGDSLTWGVGLAPSQRYTELAEKKLEAGGSPVEVLNFGLRHISTVQEAVLLRELLPVIDPDVVAVAYCINDVQPRSQDWSPERQAFEERVSGYFDFLEGLRSLRLIHVAGLLERGAFAIAETAGIVPNWVEALDRNYQESSADWALFLKGLKSIHDQSKARTRYPPVFLVLDSLLTDNGTARDYAIFSDHIVKRWNEKAEQAAKQAGFLTSNVRKLIEKLPPGTPLAVNRADGHPSAELNKLYAEELAKLIAQSVQSAQ